MATFNTFLQYFFSLGASRARNTWVCHFFFGSKVCKWLVFLLFGGVQFLSNFQNHSKTSPLRAAYSKYCRFYKFVYVLTKFCTGFINVSAFWEVFMGSILLKSCRFSHYFYLALFVFVKFVQKNKSKMKFAAVHSDRSG